MADCPFCRDNADIAVLESRDWLAIYNRSPLTTGHCLVIPRQHVATLTALSRSEVASFFAFAADVNRLVLAACNTDQFDWALQQGVHAGQSVEHLHLHVIPRQAGDLASPDAWFHELTGRPAVDSGQRKALSRDEMRKYVQGIRRRSLDTLRPGDGEIPTDSP